MIRFTTFGGPLLRDASGKSIDCIVAQPRRLALLTYLALETRKAPLRRDVIIGMFWPEVSQTRASRSLSQAIHFLRKALGTEVLSEPGRGDARINAHELSCDACAFLSAIEAQQFGEAVELYTGDFLRGFYVGDAPDFEEWAEEQRLYFRRRASEAAVIEARRAAADGHAVMAANYARRATELGLFAEPLVREQMELLASVGDTAGALEAYEHLRRRMKREVEGDPAPETEALADRLRKAGAAATVSSVTASPARQIETPAAPDKGKWWRMHPRVATAAVALLTLSATLSAWGLKEAAPDAVERTAVIWIDDFAEEGVANGVGHTVTAALLREFASVTGFAARHVSTGFADSIRYDQQEPIVLRGSVSSSPWLKGYSVTVRLTNGMTGEGVGLREFRYDSVQIAQSGRVADDIAEFARVEAGRYYKTKALTDLSPEDSEAIVLANRYRVRGDSLREDGQAASALTAFGAADSMLAQISGGRRTAAVAYAERADVWLARAWVFVTAQAFNLDEFKASAARALVLTDSALATGNRYAFAQELRGRALQLLYQALPADSAAKLEQFLKLAEGALTTAVDIAPARARSWALLSSVYSVQGRYGESFAAAQRSYAANAFMDQSSEVLHRLFSGALEIGDATEAGRWCGEINRRYADNWLATDCRLHTLAWSKPTRKEFKEAAELVARHETLEVHAQPMVARLAMVLGVVGARAGLPLDSALAIQDRAIASSRNDPELAPFRAWLWQTANRPDSARAVIDAYVSGDPIRRAGTLKSRRFRTEPLIAAHQSLQ